MAARYSCIVLVSVGTRHCAQCVDSLCSYLGDSDTNNAGLVRNQDLNQHVKRRTLHVCVGLSDFRQRLTADYTTGPVCCLRRYTGRSHTPTAFMQNGFEQLNTWLSRLHSLLIRQVALVIAITS